MKRLSEIVPVNSFEALQAIWREIEAMPGTKVFVAIKDDTILGTISLNVVHNLTRSGRPYGLVENVAVDTTVRRQGIGHMLMQRVIAAAQDAQCDRVVLLAGRRDPSVPAFYEACGFTGDLKTGFHMQL